MVALSSWADEMEKIAESSRKTDTVQLLKALGVVGAGTVDGAGLGGLTARALRDQMVSGSIPSKLRLLQRAPYILGALGGLASLAAHIRHQRLRKYVEHGR